MNEVEEFLSNKTFYCERLRARISGEQCAANMVRAKIYEDKVYRPSFLRAPPDEENFFWKDDNDNPTTNCLECDRYEEPTVQQVEAMSSSTTIRRMPDTPNGVIERKLLIYSYNYQEKMHEEEHRYLSRPSSGQRTVAKLYDED